MTIAQHSSKTNEHFTPTEVVEASRAVLGGFDLDPASCAEANRVVLAERWIGQEIDGLTRTWSGRVFLNPPGGALLWCDGRWVPRPADRHGVNVRDVRSSQAVWWEKLVTEYASGRVTAAVFVGFTLEILRLSQHAQAAGGLVIPVQTFPRCYPAERLRFGGTSPTHANVVVYLPPSVDVASWRAFADAFGPLGYVERGAGQPHLEGSIAAGAA